MLFDTLKNFRDGKVWKRLLDAQLPIQDRLSYTSWSLPEMFESGEVDFRPRPHAIYHYTSVPGLQGILKSNRLWASSAYYLNDSSEIEYGCRLLLRAISEWQEVNRDNRSFAVDVLNVLESLFSSPLSQVSRRSTIYVACFCENDNLLSQWRAYGQSGGYSLGFRVSLGVPAVALRVPGGFWGSRLAQVNYAPGYQLNRIHSLLRTTLVALSDIPNNGRLTDAEIKDLLKDAATYIEELLLDEIVTFKNPAFREEKEWRLIVRPNLVNIDDQDEFDKALLSIRLRQSRGALIPYLEVSPKGEKLPITSIRFGPTLDASRTEHSVRLLLSSNEFSGVNVVGSKFRLCSSIMQGQRTSAAEAVVIGVGCGTAEAVP